MALFKARALYDFNGEPGTAEMTITANDILTVTRTDVGEGWWEGLNSQGQSGLFPEAYVEKIESSKPPSMPAPVLPQVGSWEEPAQTPTTPSGGGQQDDDWDDEWDNDDTYSEIPNNNTQQPYYGNDNQNQFSYGNQADNVSESGYSIDGKGTVTKKSLNRFSTYVKSGLESYILGTLKPPGTVEKIHIIKDNEAIKWNILTRPYTVQVTSPKKESKMGGLKSFIAYRLTPSHTGIEVSRRYKHFDWLHDRLTDKFNVIAIPPLPDKQISGRYEDQFIEHRRVQLQEFVDYMCRHPVLSNCEVWQHFLSCTDDKQWKQGKRNAERDPLVGANFCLCIEAPDNELLSSHVDSQIELSMNYLTQMEQAIKGLMNTAMDQQKKYVNMYKREYTRVGESFLILAAACEAADRGMFSQLSVDIKNIGGTYAQIGVLFGEQAKVDWQPLADKLYLYRGVVGCFPDMFNLQKNAEHKKKECEKNREFQPLAIGEVRKRTDVLTYAVFAELDHFQTERNNEFKLAMKTFLQEQVKFYKNIVGRLEDTLAKFQ